MELSLKCKYFFHIFYTILQWKKAPSPGNAALLRLDVYKDNIRADALDTAPGDHQVLFWGTQTQNTAASGYHNGKNMSLRKLDAAVGYKAQPPPVMDADDFLAQ